MMVVKVVFHVDVRPCACFSDENSTWGYDQKNGVFHLTCKTCGVTVVSQGDKTPKIAVIDSEDGIHGLDGKPLPRVGT